MAREPDDTDNAQWWPYNRLATVRCRRRGSKNRREWRTRAASLAVPMATSTRTGYGASFAPIAQVAAIEAAPEISRGQTTGRELPPAPSTQLTDLLADTGGNRLGRADIETGVSRIGGRGLARFHRVQRHHRLKAHFERTLANLAE